MLELTPTRLAAIEELSHILEPGHMASVSEDRRKAIMDY